MGSALVWAAIPHNSDGVVFQVRVIRGLQRFHISRQTLEETFDLAPMHRMQGNSNSFISTGLSS